HDEGDALVLVSGFADAPFTTTAATGGTIEPFELELTPDGRTPSYRLRTEGVDYARLVAVDLLADLPAAPVQVVEVRPADAVFGPVIPPDGSGIVASIVANVEADGPRSIAWAELVDGLPDASRTVVELGPGASSALMFTPNGRWLIVDGQSITIARVEQ